MISEVHAMAPPQGQQGAPSGGIASMLFPMAVIMLIFYFILIRPQKRREMQHRQFLEGMKKGDEVMTNSGIYGRVAGITDNVITLEVAQNVRIRVAKSSISGLQPDSSNQANQKSAKKQAKQK